MKTLPLKPDLGGWKARYHYERVRDDGYYNGSVTEYDKTTRTNWRLVRVHFNAFWVNDDGGVQITVDAQYARASRRYGIMSLAKGRAFLRRYFGIRYSP